MVWISGGKYATKGFIDAYDPETGECRWRFYTIPGPDEPGGDTWPFTGVRERGGGGTCFMPPSFDPARGLFFVTARETCATFIPQKPEFEPG